MRKIAVLCDEGKLQYPARVSYGMGWQKARQENERRVDNYELNWCLVMAMQLMGESQVGGSILGLFLDLTREAFQNVWAPMEDALDIEQCLIGHKVVNSNLLKETMGKIAVLCDDCKLQYPDRVLCDIGW
jgi:hypothetical protein